MPDFQLTPFSPLPGVSVSGGAMRERGGRGLRATFRLLGVEQVLLPPPSLRPQERDGLWQDTCFELFFGAPGEAAYFELNLSPSGDWAAYAFSAYRQRVAPLFGLQVFGGRPRAATDGSGAMELDLVLATEAELPPELELGASAVLAHGGGARSYWALTHPAEKPDFHDRRAFLLRL